MRSAVPGDAKTTAPLPKPRLRTKAAAPPPPLDDDLDDSLPF
jgi:hypothetical protein